jgi:hypothetical protein
MNGDEKLECTACGALLPVDSTGPCPNCGKTGMKKFYKNLDAALSFTGTLDTAKIHDALSFNKNAIVGLVVTIVLSAVCSYFLSGPRGLLVSIGLGIIGIVLGYHAFMKIRTIERYIETLAKR